MSLKHRAIAEELMDGDDLDAETYAAVVGDLARVNAVTMAGRPTIDFLRRGTAGLPRFSLLDVGFGDGDDFCFNKHQFIDRQGIWRT